MELAKVLQAEVCALHAIGSLEGIFNNTYNALYIEDYHNSKKAALGRWADSFTTRQEYSGVPVTTFCEVGSVSGLITKYVDANPVELLVMGTMGSSGISGLFGSNASTMVEKTKIPTLIIPLESKFSTRPTITLATDFASDSNLSAEDVTALKELVLAFASEKLNVLHILESPEWKVNEAGEESLKKLISGTTLDFKYIQESNPIDGIMNFIVSSETDILCLVKRHHGLVYRIFNTSTVNKVMARAIKAILVLHE